MSLINEGKIRIGTLGDFRKQESHSPGIGDAGEGYLRHETGPFYRPRDSGDIPAGLFRMAPLSADMLSHAARMFGISEEQAREAARPTFTNSIFEEILDAYIFCFTDNDKSTSFPHCDAVLKVDDVQTFVEAVTAGLLRNGIAVSPLGIKKCVYQPRKNRLDENGVVHDAWYRKDPSFAHQSEFRAGWSAAIGGTLEPRIIVVPELRSLAQMM